MVGIAAIGIPAMGRHELDHLQGAFRAVYVRDLDIGFLFLIEGRGVHEQTVGKNRVKADSEWLPKQSVDDR